MPSYRPLWLNRDLAKRIEAFIREKYKINPDFGKVFTEVARGGILFALSKPDEFEAFLDKKC